MHKIILALIMVALFTVLAVSAVAHAPTTKYIMATLPRAKTSLERKAREQFATTMDRMGAVSLSQIHRYPMMSDQESIDRMREYVISNGVCQRIRLMVILKGDLNKDKKALINSLFGFMAAGSLTLHNASKTKMPLTQEMIYAYRMIQRTLECQ